ncbi:MAG: hypothetical protein FD135_2378 [Comamonadaceae bacterium]|nr:MAG: hypothetical protein FD135_2378 [Comamonadaceae bacterium]
MNEPGEPERGRVSVGWPAVTVGYSHDLMLAVVERIRKELKLPALAVKLVQNSLIDLDAAPPPTKVEGSKCLQPP